MLFLASSVKLTLVAFHLEECGDRKPFVRHKLTASHFHYSNTSYLILSKYMYQIFYIFQTPVPRYS